MKPIHGLISQISRLLCKEKEKIIAGGLHDCICINHSYSYCAEYCCAVLLPGVCSFSWFVCKFLCALIAFLIALQWKCENLLGEKQIKFTEMSTPQGLEFEIKVCFASLTNYRCPCSALTGKPYQVH